MNREGIFNLIKAASLIPVPLEGNPDWDRFKGDLFSGSIEEFLKTSLELGSKVIFFQVSYLTDEDFLEVSEFSDEEEGEGDDEPIEEQDLRKVHPQLVEFNQHLNEVFQILFVAKGGVAELGYTYEADWVSGFFEGVEVATEKLSAKLGEKQKKSHYQKALKAEELKKLVRAALKNDEFMAIPTQRGMRAWLLEKHPVLKELHEIDLTYEIQAVHDKIKTMKRAKR